MLTYRLRRGPIALAGSLCLGSWLAACGDSTTGFDDASSAGSGAASGWTFVPPGSGAPSSSGGKPGSGGKAATAGSGQGGQAGKAGSSSAGSGGMPSKPVTFPCRRTVPSQPAITSFDGYQADGWQSPGNLEGGGYVYPSSLELAMGDFLGTEGQIEDYSGIGAWFSGCIDASQFKGIRFSIFGSVGPTSKVALYLITNRTKDVNEVDSVGACVPEDPDDAWASCRPPTVSVPVMGTPATHSVPWTAFKGGLPGDTTDGSDIIALQWSFAWDDADPYPAKLSVDDLTFYTDGGSNVGGGGGGGTGGGSGTGGIGGGGGSSGGGGGNSSGSGGSPAGQAGAPLAEPQGGASDG